MAASLACVAARADARDLNLITDRTITFDRRQALSEQKFDMASLKADRDWSAYKNLVIEFRASGSQRFRVYLYSGDTASPLYIMPFQGVWTRAVVPLEMFEAPPSSGGVSMSGVFNKQRIGYYMGHWGPYLSRSNVDALSFAMEHPVGAPTIEVRKLYVTDQAAEDAILENRKLVDEFGQWKSVTWAGKAKTLAELTAAWRAEEQTLGMNKAAGSVPRERAAVRDVKVSSPGQASAPRYPDGFKRSRFGGFTQRRVRATSFFRVERVNGKWWFVDPEGYLFLSTGANATRPNMWTVTADRAGIYDALPPDELIAPLRAADGRDASRTSFQAWNLARRHGAAWQERWTDLTLRRMQAWGMNTIANWSSPLLHGAQRVPYVLTMRDWTSGKTYLGMPDVFSDEFARACDESARRQVAARRDDKYLIGYFIGNEPPWARYEKQIIDAILEGEETATKRELTKSLAAGDTPARRTAFFERLFERFFAVTTAAVRRHDPNHLVLGIRFGGTDISDAQIRANQVFDVFSLNTYEYAPDEKIFAQVQKLIDKPILIGEFHFGVPERGLSAGLKQTSNQRERGAAYRYYVEQAFKHPNVVGAHWFQWWDQPATGREDGENYQIGLVDITDRPYAEMVEAMKETHKRLYEVHDNRTAAFARRAAIN